MKKIIVRVALGILVLLFLASAGFVVWASFPLGPSPEAQQVLKGGDPAVKIEQISGWTVFRPVEKEPQTGLIFYPGGRVDYRSYSPELDQIAAQGNLVVLVPMPLSMAAFSPDEAAKVIPAFPQIQHWAIGGHSLGGAMAARYAYLHPDQIEGLVLWASYPAGDNSLASSTVKVVSIYGINDHVASQAKRDAYKNLLPADTRWVAIEGGNHAQFGSYGLQPGDGTATIPPQEQWAQVTSATAQSLADLSK
jgi:hypothetical protein